MQSKFILGSALPVLVAMASSCSAPLSAREQGGLIGARVGAARAPSSAARWAMPPLAP
jgi:hypothetical protein